MYKDLLKQLLDKYGTTNDELNYFLDLIGAYYLFRRNEWENDNDNEETKDRVTPTISDIRKELRLIRQLKEENNADLLEYIKDQSIAYIIGIEQLFYQFNIDIWYCHIDKAERLLDSWYRAIWYYGYYQERNKDLSDELLAYLENIDKVILSEQDIENNASLKINEKTKLCYLLAKYIHKNNKKDELLDLVQYKDNLLNSRVLTNLTLTTDLDKMLELTTRLTYHYLDTAILLDSITICFNDDIDNIIKKHNEELFNYDDIKDKVEDLKTYFLENDNVTDTEKEQQTPSEHRKTEEKKPKVKVNNKPKKATKEEMQEFSQQNIKDDNYYMTNNTPTNRTILDTYGAWASIETNTLDKTLLKITKKEKELKNAKTTKEKSQLKAELSLLNQEKINQERIIQELEETITTNKNNLRDLITEYEAKKDTLNNTEQKQYETTINILKADVSEHEQELESFNNKGIVFRGNIFNHLEYIDKKGRTIATLRNKDGQPLESSDIPPLANAFLRLSNDYFYNRLDNYNDFIDKIDVLFPKDKGVNYKIANNTIKNNLGKTGYIINVKELLKMLNLSEDSYKYFGKTLEETIKFFNDIEINIKQEDIFTTKKDVLNIFFGITSNVFISRQLDNNIYLYYEISTPYEAILDNEGKPLVAQTPKALLKYSVGQKGNKRVFALGDYFYTILRESLNNGRGGVKIDKNGNFYKTFKVGTLIRKLKERGLLNKEARPTKYRRDIFDPFITALNVLSEDDNGNGEHFIEYTLYYDDSVSMSNDTFKTTFEASLVKITYLDVSDEYENILSKNMRNKPKANITNANKFILTWGKYEGKTLKEVLDIDKQYLQWVLTNEDIKIPKPKITRQHIKNLLDYEKAKEQLKK